MIMYSAFTLVVCTAFSLTHRSFHHLGHRNGACSGGFRTAISNANSNSFDIDFAEMMSKPLPEWYKEELVEKANHEKELEAKRLKMIEEFNIRNQQAEIERIEKNKRRESRRKANNKKQVSSWFLSAAAENKIEEDDGDEYLDLSTKEKWDQFLEEEKKNTGFYFPGFFEVFPELKFKWPIWAKKKDGGAIKCKTDKDCRFPQACCSHPFIPGDKFCCTGWTQRVMVPAYQRQVIAQSQPPSSQPPPSQSPRPFP